MWAGIDVVCSAKLSVETIRVRSYTRMDASWLINRGMKMIRARDIKEGMIVFDDLDQRYPYMVVTSKLKAMFCVNLLYKTEDCIVVSIPIDLVTRKVLKDTGKVLHYYQIEVQVIPGNKRTVKRKHFIGQTEEEAWSFARSLYKEYGSCMRVQSVKEFPFCKVPKPVLKDVLVRLNSGRVE